MVRPSANTERLLQEAKKSGNGEAFEVLAKRQYYRASEGVRLGSPDGATFFLEVLVYLCPPAAKLRIPELEMKLEFMKALKERGYSMNCEDDGCISCEAVLPPQELMSEPAAIKSIANRIFEKSE